MLPFGFRLRGTAPEACDFYDDNVAIDVRPVNQLKKMAISALLKRYLCLDTPRAFL
jgi:hypothetical protein